MPDPAPPPAPADYAVVVGINDYTPGIRRLQGCVNDARLFTRWLLDPAGGGLDPSAPADVAAPRHVETICSPGVPDGPLRPIKDEVEDVLFRLFQRFLDTGVPVGRRLYLWFSGHGVSPRGDLMDCALLMANASQLALGRAIPGRRAAEYFRRGAMFAEVVLMMDCCREVGGLADAGLSIDFQPDPTAGTDVRWLYGFATRTSAISAERELPHPFDPVPMQADNPRLWHGAFTHAVLEGLQRGADPAGRVTSASLASYVRERVPALLDPANNQRPDFEMSDDPIVFGAGLPFEVTVRLTNPASGFQVLDGMGLTPIAAVPQPAPGGTFRVSLPPGLYLFVVPQTGGGFLNAAPLRVMAGGDLHVTL